jgi:hypothetical protein
MPKITYHKHFWIMVEGLKPGKIPFGHFGAAADAQKILDKLDILSFVTGSIRHVRASFFRPIRTHPYAFF